jgi:hypothetical protein
MRSCDPLVDAGALAILEPVLLAGSRARLAVEAGTLLQRVAPWDLFTILACDHARREVVRLHSSDPANHAPGGRKPFNPLVLRPAFVAGRATHRCIGKAELAACYANDRAVGPYDAAINVPVVWEGELKGMVNLLRKGDGFAQSDGELLALGSVTLPLFLSGHQTVRAP